MQNSTGCGNGQETIGPERKRKQAVFILLLFQIAALIAVFVFCGSTQARIRTGAAITVTVLVLLRMYPQKTDAGTSCRHERLERIRMLQLCGLAAFLSGPVRNQCADLILVMYALALIIFTCFIRRCVREPLKKKAAADENLEPSYIRNMGERITKVSTDHNIAFLISCIFSLAIHSRTNIADMVLDTLASVGAVALSDYWYRQYNDIIDKIDKQTDAYLKRIELKKQQLSAEPRNADPPAGHKTDVVQPRQTPDIIMCACCDARTLRRHLINGLCHACYSSFHSKCGVCGLDLLRTELIAVNDSLLCPDCFDRRWRPNTHGDETPITEAADAVNPTGAG